MLQYYATLLHATWLGRAMAGGVPWLWPTFEIAHLIGMAFLLGCVGAIDLRLLGIAKGVPLASLSPLRSVSVIGFTMTLITGLGFFAGDPTQYLNNISVFGAKLLFVALAAANSLLFYSSGMAKSVWPMRSHESAPGGAKAFAAASLALWIGVMFWGRMLSIAGGAF